ncbi:hypothetical protein BKA70DRAFT_1516711 [Coprinopsis sp. MPI-PUGE-AT-0042]|nr:hypothetical protein BKA70DRAFT_1516711 [Coprinopsis sp. MPI-PUGE-AT-0042]
MVQARRPEGSRKKLVLPFDVVTIFSGISYRFNLHIRPNSRASTHVTSSIQQLLLNKTVEVLSDFLQYLYKMESEIDYVISHLNGWEGSQHSQIREAIVLAQLIPDTTAGHDLSPKAEQVCTTRLMMVSRLVVETESSVDAGDGAIDVSAYAKKGDTGKDAAELEEIAAPQCHFQGSIFVSVHARLFLEDFPSESDFIEDPEHDASVLFWHDLGVKCIVEAVDEQIEDRHPPLACRPPRRVFGFPLALPKVDEAHKSEGLNDTRPENHVNKAVSGDATPPLT